MSELLSCGDILSLSAISPEHSGGSFSYIVGVFHLYRIKKKDEIICVHFIYRTKYQDSLLLDILWSRA